MHMSHSKRYWNTDEQLLGQNIEVSIIVEFQMRLKIVKVQVYITRFVILSNYCCKYSNR